MGTWTNFLGSATAAVRWAGRRVPLATPLGCMAASFLVVFGLTCAMPPLLMAARAGLRLASVPRPSAILRLVWWTSAGAGGGAVLLLQARCLLLCSPDRLAGRMGMGGGSGGKRGRGISVAGLPLRHEDLCTSVLVTGVTGSSKTAGVLLPLLARLLLEYRAPSREPLGAFIPEVKGDVIDAAVYLARRAGRDVAREVRILSASCRIPVLRFRDETGRHWFLSGRGGAAGSDAADWLPAGCDSPGPEVLEDPPACAAALEQWRRIAQPLGRCRPRFVGWRWQGRKLRRTGTDPAVVDPPATLAADGVDYIDNGVHYNLIDPRLPPAEVAERLTRLAAMQKGSGSRGENDYFYEQARKLLSACLTLLRAVGTVAPTIVDLVRCATQDDALESRLARLEERGDPRHADLVAYFRGEWLRMVAEGRTATIVRSTLSAAFDLFLHDDALRETFCQPSTLAFADIANHGTIIGFVPGERYEQVGRILGTACKFDFQSAMLARTSRPGMNRTRLALYLADECHKYAVAGSAAAGDPYFMNLSRSNQVANVCATQSYAWVVDVLGRDAANVYLSAFGVQYWLQQTDPETCRRAAEICGSVSRERVATEHDLNLPGVLTALAGGRPGGFRHRRHEEEASRFRPEDFALLDVGEVIGFNKGLRGRTGKVRRCRVEYHGCTRPPDGPRAIAASAREYHRELLEDLAVRRGLPGAWDVQGLEDAAELAAYVGAPGSPA